MNPLRAALPICLVVFSCAPSNVFTGPIIDAADDAAPVDAVVADAPSGPDAPAQPDAPDPRARVRIHIRATDARFMHNDMLSGQTATMYRMGIRRFSLLRTMNDPAPLLVFDHGNGFVEAGFNGGDDTVVGAAPAVTLTAGRFAVGRVVLTHMRYAVQAMMHSMGVNVPGSFDNVQVISRDTTLDGTLRQRGWFRYVFHTGTLQYPLEGMGAPPIPTAPAGAPITTSIEGDETVLYFPVDITVVPSAPRDVNVVMEFNVFESFRWEDQMMPGYARGVFDTSPTATEPVRRFGANSYRVFSE